MKNYQTGAIDAVETTQVHARQATSKHPDLRNLLFLSIAWLALIAFLRPIGDFPLNDDWTYALSVKSIVDTGRFQLLDWSQAIVIAQAYWGAIFCKLFGFSFTVLRLSTLILALGSILLTYMLLREARITPSLALMGTAAIAVNPLFFCLSNTFMTDIPFYAFFVLSLYFLVYGLNRNCSSSIAAGLLTAFCALLTRQLGIVIPLGFAIVVLWKGPRNIRTAVIAIAPLLALLTAYFLVQHWVSLDWKVSQAQHSPLALVREIYWRLAGGKALGRLFEVLMYAGLFTLPVALCTLRSDLDAANSEQKARIGIRTVLLIAMTGSIAYALEVSMPFGRNVLTYFGFGPLSLRDTLMLKINLPEISVYLNYTWKLITALSILGTAILLERAWRAGKEAIQETGKHRKLALTEVTALVWVVLIGYTILITTATPTFFDRYLLPCIPLTIMLLASRHKEDITHRIAELPHTIGWLVVVLSGIFSVAAMHDYLAWNKARWDALALLTYEKGISPRAIDGGYEFNGWLLGKHGGPPKRHGKSWWWVEDDKYVIAMGGIDGYRELGRYPFKPWLFNAPSHIVVLERER